MSATLAQVVLLIQHFSAILKTFVEKAVPVAALGLSILDKASPLLTTWFPALGTYAVAIKAALTFIVNHGTDVSDDIDKVLQLFSSVDSVVPKLAAAADTPALTSAVSQ